MRSSNEVLLDVPKYGFAVLGSSFRFRRQRSMFVNKLKARNRQAAIFLEIIRNTICVTATMDKERKSMRSVATSHS